MELNKSFLKKVMNVFKTPNNMEVEQLLMEISALQVLNCRQFRSMSKENFSIVNNCSKMG